MGISPFRRVRETHRPSKIRIKTVRLAHPYRDFIDDMAIIILYAGQVANLPHNGLF
jgi:hypothetical protein